MRRSSPALFELMRRGDAAGGAVRVPSQAATPEPVTPHPAPEGAASAAGSESESGIPAIVRAMQRRLSLSVSTALMAAGGVLLLCVIVWSAAYQAGAAREKAAAARDLEREAPPTVREPLTDSVPVNPHLMPDPARGSQPSPAPAAPATAQPPIRVDGDPREPGRNYYQLITTDKDEADRLIAFLGENGVSAFIVGVDRGGKPTNNPARFSVFCSRGITPEEFKNQDPVRTELQQKIVVLGQRWQRELKGSTNFSGAYWNKYSP